MGCSPGDSECSDDEKPAHQVTITKGFWLGQTPVTQEAYQRVIGKNPSFFRGSGTLPVEVVNWQEARAYCHSVGGRLPTEAEWEYAARGETTGARYGDLDQIAGYDRSGTYEVGQKQPNAFGLYDMLGNVRQWVADWYGDYSAEAQSDPPGPESGQDRVRRGGSWIGEAGDARASYRIRDVPENRYNSVGFRCVAE
jgi:formylglycine-generating enzyme required for sulfatase activity